MMHVKPSLIFLVFAVTPVVSGCMKRVPGASRQDRPKRERVEVVNFQEDRSDKPGPQTKCTLPRLDERMHFDFAKRRQPGKAWEAALSPGPSSKVGSLRPVFVDESQIAILAKQAPPLRAKRRLQTRSVTAGPRWIPTCDSTHPLALLRDVEILKSSMPTNFNKNGRNLDKMYRICGTSLPWNPSGQPEDKIINHDLSEDRSRCILEVRGNEDPSRDSEQHDHMLRVMRSRIHKGEIEFQALTYRVPEQDWPYLAEVVRKSAESFEAVFD